MSGKRLIYTLCLVFAFAGAAIAAESRAQIAHDIGTKVICLCGCRSPLNDCPDQPCPVQATMQKIINTDLAQGMTEQATIQDLVHRFGEKVMVAPPAHGFNLTAWILPGLGLIIGLLLAIAVVRRWRRPELQPAAAASPLDDHVRAAVEEEMKKYVD